MKKSFQEETKSIIKYTRHMKIKYISTALIFLMIASYHLSAQKTKKNIKVSGMVIDNSNNPVASALLTIDGTLVASSTDEKGKFKLIVPPATKNIGVFVTSGNIIEEPINGRSELNIVIPDSTHKLILELIRIQKDEEIYIGYSTIKKKDLTNVVNKAGSKEYNFSNYSNIYDLISGKFPGVLVSGNSINIQGSSSFVGASTEPLFVVDGNIVETISFIAPSSVNSIEILKGASASIYGSRGANGVILITLKKGGDK